MAVDVMLYQHTCLLEDGTLRQTDWCSLTSSDLAQERGAGFEIVATDKKSMQLSEAVVEKMKQRQREAAERRARYR